MPIYEYQCANCGHTLESFQKMSDAPLTQCPSCQQNTLQKLVSAAGFQLKGTGWYATDFKDKSKAKTDTKETKSEVKPTESKETKSDNSNSSSTSTETKQ